MMKRKNAFLLFAILLLLNSCSKAANGQETPETPEMPENAVTDSSFGKSIRADLGGGREESAPSPLDPSVSWLEISPEKNLTVYVSRDSEHPQVIVYKNQLYYSYDWKYDLAYGDPIVFVENNRMYTGTKQIDRELVVFLPTSELEEPLSPVGAREICGEEHVLDYNEPGCEIPANRHSEGLTAAYRQNADGKKVLSVINSDGEAFMEFPELELPEQDIYSVVSDPVLHCTDTGLRYQRLGIAAGEKTVWIGKYCDGVLFPDAELGYYLPEGERIDGAYQQAWQLRPLEPDALLDLDGDGTAEKISWRFVPSQYRQGHTFRILIDGELQQFDLASDLAMVLYTASLDGKSNQIIALDYGAGRSRDLVVFQYGNGGLNRAGRFCDGQYRKAEDCAGNVYISTASCYLLQNEQFEQKQEFADGMLWEVPQDYYEFIPLYRDNEAEAPRHNIIVTREPVDLYRERNSAETFQLPQGSSIVLLGSDRKEWILVENQDTGEPGWLRRTAEDDSAVYCILADGSEGEKDSLCEG
ncbi:MAG: hypothetical protein K2N94_01395, partial [Lachnospiraceae bacterium]|nr:hypothetical protein [Lachnospiraceae bacterium]